MIFRNSPMHCDTQVIAELFEKYVEPMQMKKPPMLNAETMVSGRLNEIDLRRLYDIRQEVMPNGEIWTYDDNSFDPDPESGWNCIGRDRDPHESLLDLLDQIAEADGQ